MKAKASHIETQDEKYKLVNHISARTRSCPYPLQGGILEIGSCKDGTKLDPIDEIDLLFELKENQIEILANGKLRWGNREYTIREFRRHFDNFLDEVLCTNVPAGFDHGGYASPQYSGLRINGTATTLPVTNCKHTTALNITPCFPVDCANAICGEWVKSLRSKCSSRQLPTNLKPHLVPNVVEEKLEISTAHIEAELLYAVQGCIIHKAYIWIKALLDMVDNFASKIYDDQKNKGKKEVNNVSMTENMQNGEEDRENTDQNTEEMERNINKNSCCNNSVSCPICSDHNGLNEDMSEVQRLLLNKRLKYEHNILPNPAYHGELSKLHLSTNNTVSKHILLRHATQDDFRELQRMERDVQRLFQLMKLGIKEFSAASTDTHVAHCATIDTDVANSPTTGIDMAHSSLRPPDIPKFSCRRTLLGDCSQMVINHRELYTIMLEHMFTEVGIK